MLDLTSVIAIMIPRRLQAVLEDRLRQFPSVALLGPRQVGKTTLARATASALDSLYLDLENPIDLAKLADARGFLAESGAHSAIWRENFVRTYLERDIPLLGPRVPAETLRRFWTMLAHGQGGVLNAASLARSLAVDGKTVAKYLDLVVDLLLVRRLPPFHANVRKRLIKSPKTYAESFSTTSSCSTSCI